MLSTTFTHHLVRGETDSAHYGNCYDVYLSLWSLYCLGLSLASLSMLPQSILDDADQIVKEIQLQKAVCMHYFSYMNHNTSFLVKSATVQGFYSTF